MSKQYLLRALWVLLAVFTLLLLVWIGLWLANKDRVPRGVSIAGVEIGGMRPTAAEDTLKAELGPRVNDPVQVRAGEKTATVVASDAGVQPDWGASVESAGQVSINPFRLIYGYFADIDLPMSSTIDEPKMAAELERLSQELRIDPVNGGVEIQGGHVITHDAHEGQDIDREDLGIELSTRWLQPGGIEASLLDTEPMITQKEVERVAQGPAAKAVSAPLTAVGRDDVRGVLPAERMGEVISFTPDEPSKELKTQVNADNLRGILAEGLKASEQPKKNASIDFSDGGRRIIPHQDGVVVDWEESLKDVEQRITANKDREFAVQYKDEPATFTTEMAENATFDDVVGEFTTGGFSGPSGQNIALVARTVNGAMVAPGDTFSLNSYTGPRGAAQGYVKSGIILNGRADNAVGGGISQFATTLFNAAYFAGMEDVAHTPHSYYISRYPAGREATVFEGAIDLQFKNTSPYPVRIDTSVDSGSVTVRLMGVKTVNVESINGGRWAPTQPKEMRISGEGCVASSGAPGFTTSDTRIVRDLAGNEIGRNTTTTVYDPEPIVRCS
nr:VanW family protein [Corynebacterium poyangense]